MLLELDIANYAVVEKQRVAFRRGLNLLTGETGSGKSILVDALALLFGARGGAEVVRAGASKARITGVFEIDRDAALAALLEEAGVDADDELILERQILATGKSRAYINGRPAPIGQLKTFAPFLGDIHGQHEQQNLFSTRAQLEMLDAFAGVAALAAEVAEIHRDWRDCARKLQELRGNEQERLRLLDLYRFQAQEIQGANLSADEEEELEAERRKLRNVEKLQTQAGVAYDALYDSSVSAAVQLKAAQKACEDLAGLDKTFEPWAATLDEVRATVQDIGFELQSYLDNLEGDPARLDGIEERLAQIEKLKRKYGKSLAEVIAYGAEVAAKARELEEADQSAEAVEKRRREIGKRYLETARRLSQERRRAGERLEKRIHGELADLAMDKARFVVALDSGESEERWTADGFDRLRFEFSANAGQPVRPLAQVASGGELSRITLALKTCLLGERAPAASGVPRTLVFDEIDTGVGGRVADAIGRRLKKLAGGSQVLCVTHLPQIAGFADAHYTVGKESRGEQTYASVVELRGEARVEELARMLSGAEVTAAALENARQLLETVKS